MSQRGGGKTFSLAYTLNDPLHILQIGYISSNCVFSSLEITVSLSQFNCFSPFIHCLLLLETTSLVANNRET